jgi:hypothetical protein
LLTAGKRDPTCTHRFADLPIERVEPGRDLRHAERQGDPFLDGSQLGIGAFGARRDAGKGNRFGIGPRRAKQEPAWRLPVRLQVRVQPRAAAA